MNQKLIYRLIVPSATKIKKYNWKDYQQSETMPQDNNKHKTAILSIVHYIAPFADICIARIAGKDKDLKRNLKTTNSNLTKVFLQRIKIIYLITNTTIAGYPLGCGEARRKYRVSIPKLGTEATQRQNSRNQQYYF